jgi:hypothetical protein
MFNIREATKRLLQLEYDKVNGLEIKHSEPNPAVKHIDSEPYDIQATKEHVAIKRAFKSKTIDFGKRLRKRRGENHKRRGHYSCGSYTFKGLPNCRR